MSLNASAERSANEATEAAVAAEAWPALIPLERSAAPAIDPAIVGGPLGDMAAAVAASIEVPPELPLGVGLAVASSVVARHFHVEMTPGYTEPPVIWTASVEQPGGRKSATHSAMTAPVTEWESQRFQGMKREMATAQMRAEVLKQRIRELTSKAAKAMGDEAAEIIAKIEDAQAQLSDAPVVPRRVVQDVTAERVAAMLGEHGEVLLMASDEGGLFDQFSGRYNAKGVGPNLDIWLQAHAGSPVRVDRKSGAPIALDRPRLAVSVMPQPSLVAQLQAKDGLRSRGLLARFCWLVPLSRVGFRTFSGQPITPAASLAWRNALLTYLDRADPIDGTIALRPSPEALAAWRAFVADVEPRQRPGRDLAHMSDWASKSTGLVARIAGVLHAIGTARPEHATISYEIMGRAIALVRLLIEHAKAAFAVMKANTALATAEAIWSVICRMDTVDSVSGRDVHRSLCGSYPKADDLAPGWAVLVDRAYVRALPPPKKQGRPAVRYELNPAAVEGICVNKVNGSLDTILDQSLSPNTPSSLSADDRQNGQNPTAEEMKQVGSDRGRAATGTRKGLPW